MTSDEELKALAAQLRHPSGDMGIEIADMMNETNAGMTKHAILCLDMQANDVIMELGHGNCRHLSYLLQQSSGLRYYGLEMSELMNAEAEKINQPFTRNKQAAFYLYDAKQVPFTGNFFDKIFTVNTIYFWEEPFALISELYRVLKPGGTLCITFAIGSFMKQLPFTKFGFELYDTEKIEQLMASVPFNITAMEPQLENVKTKTGEMVEREFMSVVAGK